MKLKELYIKGFKCFKDSGRIPIHSLTIFIGENDSGKSSILEAIDVLLNNKSINPEHYHIDIADNTTSSTIEISGVFDVNEDEGAAKDLLLNGKLHLIKRLNHENGIQYFIKKEAFSDDRLNSLDRQLMPELKEILKKFGLDTSGLKQELIEKIRTHLNSNPQPISVREIEIQWRLISELVPIFQRYTSSDYGNPQNLIAKVLSNVYRTYFYETDEKTGEEKLKYNFGDLKSEIESNLDLKIKDSLKDVIKKYNPKVCEVRGRYTIDFAKGLNFHQLEIDTGSGLKPIGNRGEGSKKRLYLAILEWDKEIENELPPISRGMIKAYDEPDSNLHFGAQRKLFYTIQKECEQKDHVQNIICTHAITMIDKAPALSINCLTPNEYEQSEVRFLETDEEDDDVREFLSQVSEIGGIRNSSIFYEKCFLLVEGPSEENAIPILYKKCFGKNLAEDGIVLINLESNGGWKNFLKLLKKNKEDCTVLFLDSDTQLATSTAAITLPKLTEIGFSANFLSNNVFFVGGKEFEDIYPDDILTSMLNNKYPKEDGQWNVEEILELKNTSQKFSEDLRIAVSREHKKRVGKPDIALELAKVLTKDEILNIAKIKSLFEKLELIIN